MLKLVDELNAAGIRLQYIDLGGGLGIRYHDESPPTVGEYAAALSRLLKGVQRLSFWSRGGFSLRTQRFC